MVNSPLDISGVILAGGEGRRMGGLDKGLQIYQGRPLIEHAIHRLSPQVSTLVISANRHQERYGTYGYPVVSDDSLTESPPHAGPLAGLLAAMQVCTTSWLVSVPCDTPHLPLHLVTRLYEAQQQQGVDLVIAASQDAELQTHVQPVFCLMKTHLRSALAHFIQQGGRKVMDWVTRHPHAQVVFRWEEAPRAFLNINTLEQLQTT